MATAAASVLSPSSANPAPSVSDSDTGSSSSGDEAAGISGASALEDSIFAAYLQICGGHSPSHDLIKIRSFLSAAAGRGGHFVSCLICLERIRPSDPIWSCSSGCHALFHLPCIQNWANQCSYRHSSSSSLHSTPDWHCPKCRDLYARDKIPRSYRCFCGKVEDPPSDPWILPHSCGEVCGRPLRGNCGHKCLLLCHPGVCPPCPKLITARCFCGSRKDARRCAQKHFSCNQSCPTFLPCRLHSCTERCHDGRCPPCQVKAFYKCACGKTEEERVCAESDFRCDRPCDGILKCGKHKCSRGCHSGPCGACPLQGRRTCPCGKKEYKGASCDEDVPTCGLTCEKMLSCGLHRCPERCHRGICVETCRIVVFKACRCGSLRKEVPCYQELTCERKCLRMRDCGRHACKHRCCDGECPPCQEICGRKLRCNNHKCPSLCHRGSCAPCPLMVTISCFCGETYFEVPCGVEKNQRPLKCPKTCHVSRLCRHQSQCRPHKCHYGACPPCRIICGEELSCGHICKHRCHGPIPPPNPEFTLKPKKKKMEKNIGVTPGSACPSCQEIIWVACLGQHLGEERPMVCSKTSQFSCNSLCGNLLACGNHYCTKSCHAVKYQPSSSDGHGSYKDDLAQKHGPSLLNAGSDHAESCEECLLPCQKVREPACSHPCPLPCHSDCCPPCEVLLKRSCHCGAMVHVFNCANYNRLTVEEQQLTRSCRGPCHRKLPNCPHLCSDICHPGQCPSINLCSKKVTVRCACNSLKKEWLCRDVQNLYRQTDRDPKDVVKSLFGIGLIPCNADCKSKVKVADAELQIQKVPVPKGIDVVAAAVTKRRKRRERIQVTKQVSKFQAFRSILQRCLLFTLILIVICASLCYGYKALFWLSDRMYEIERRKVKKGLSKF
ncbi:NF-X1-type zinc finger protein NFXL2 isoform X1 [Dendrobium catenatum]|uniref:NF-X1-type zinc finger protein NFXL2 isoform X1 n=1 Tax=Dendrobium catenatum TaxID=906689 RepID=UPI0009F3DE4F|nr:NF-X1-type zinc finger protein NFXL2 isoform X1 [Dendrobium catenatum]